MSACPRQQRSSFSVCPATRARGFGERQSEAPTDPTARCGTDRDSRGGWAPSSLRPARRLNCSPTIAFLAIAYINSGPSVFVPPPYLSSQPIRARFCRPWLGDEPRRPSQPCVSFPSHSRQIGADPISENDRHTSSSFTLLARRTADHTQMVLRDAPGFWRSANAMD